jgi:predicted dehydrogenase
MGYSVGIVGLGEFSPHFVPLFQAHPLVERVALAELRPGVLGRYAREFEIDETYPSFEEMLKSDLDAVAIFTQRWAHASMAIAALKAGKHVYSAVPAAVTLDELDELVKTVEETGLTYALGETSYYRPPTIYCRNRFRRGDFGRFVYGEGHYYHDMSHVYSPYYGGKASSGSVSRAFRPCSTRLTR